jgi:hypothetical protein
VVHVVQKSVVCAPRKTHKPLTITVNSGQPQSNENRNDAAGSRKAAGREGHPLFFAKVRVAGSNPVFRSKDGTTAAVAMPYFPCSGGWNS